MNQCVNNIFVFFILEKFHSILSYLQTPLTCWIPHPLPWLPWPLVPAVLAKRLRTGSRAAMASLLTKPSEDSMLAPKLGLTIMILIAKKAKRNTESFILERININIKNQDDKD